jgi:dethiobiotin synthetase
MDESNSRTLFVTGTDTGCGKTTVTALLARYLAERGAKVACFKPIASGCERADGRLVNSDALALMAAMNVKLAYDQVNPIALEPPIAPHIAAEKASIRIDSDGICSDIAATTADIRLVEGVGGWLVPLDHQRLMPELPHRLRCGILLVVGMRLGCLNHALLTARAIAGDGFRLVGWIANYLDDDFDEPVANEATLDRVLPAPRLARVRRRVDGPELEAGPGLAAALRVGEAE